MHEFLNDGFDFFAERGAKHEHLFVVRRGPKHFLYIFAHILKYNNDYIVNKYKSREL